MTTEIPDPFSHVCFCAFCDATVSGSFIDGVPRGWYDLGERVHQVSAATHFVRQLLVCPACQVRPAGHDI